MDKEDETDRPGDFKKEFEQLNTDFQSVHGTPSFPAEEQKGNVQKDSVWAWVACCCAVMNQLLIFGTLNVYSLFLVKFQKEFHCSTGEAGFLNSLLL
ncbi:hypothetical protein Btru_036839 [Bulinus truncatus]|nr:hypothetical protein Btru_036839 [Bulinus truncatus]